MELIGHLVATSFVFLVLITVVWALSWALHSLHFAYPYSAETFRLLNRLEILIIYADATLSGAVFLHGMWDHFVKIIRGDS